MTLKPVSLTPVPEVYSQIGFLCCAVMTQGSINGDDALCGYARRLAVIAKDEGLTPPPPGEGGECGIELVIFMDKLMHLAFERFPEAINETPY